jgi:hypothetical protein
MADRFPLIANPTTNQIEELSPGDNLNLENSGIVGATTITANKFIGTFEGNATSSDALNNAANILSGIVSTSRLSGSYNISVTTADNLTNAANINAGTISTERLSGYYPISVDSSFSSDSLTDASNITGGIVPSERLSGFYDISVGTANTANIITPGSFQSIDISGNAATATTATNLSGGTVSGVDLNITGIGTIGTLGVSGLTTTTNLTVTNLASIGFASVGIATIGFGTFTNIRVSSAATIGFLTATNVRVSGTATVGFLTATNLNSPNATLGIVTATTFTGLNTLSAYDSTLDFINNTRIDSGLLVGTAASIGIATIGFGTFTNVRVSGILTAGTFSGNFSGGIVATAASIGIATITYANVGLASVGIATVGFASVGIATIGFLTSTNVRVSGTATVGVLTATSIYSNNYLGSGATLVGIVTQINVGTGLTLTSTQTAGKGIVQVGIRTSIGKTIFVSFDGNDSNSGLLNNDAKKTIKAAAALALPGDTIKVFPGTYVENNPIILSKNVSIEGTELRNCLVSPQNSGLDLFHVNDGVHITNLSFIGASSTNGAAVVSLQPLAGVSTHRFFDAARMIRTNLDFIAAEAVGYLTSTSYKNPPFVVVNSSGIATNPVNCQDDIKDVLKSICYDITRGGNSKSVGAGKSYYNDSGALLHITGTDPNGYSVKTATIDALNYAIGIARSCVNNVSWTGNHQNQFTQVKDVSIQADSSTGSNIDLNSCANVVSALYSCVGIVTTIINNGLSALGGAGINTTLPSAYDGQTGNNWSNTKLEGTTFSPGVGIISKGPYIRNCTNFIPNSIGLKVNGFDAEPGDKIDNGIQGSMSVDSYTQYNQGGIGVSITNGGYAQLVSIFTICDDIAIYTSSGGQCDVTNSNSSFGTYGLYSDGVGDNTSRSIFRYTGNAVSESNSTQNTISISGIGDNRPYQGQSIYFGDLYYFVESINVTNGGSGYTSEPIVTIDSPTGPNGIRAEAFPIVQDERVVSISIISTGNQYVNTPNVIISPPESGTTATASANIAPIYYKVDSATLPSSGISTITLTENLNNTVSAGTTAYFSRMSLQVASTISFEYVGAGNAIESARPSKGGVTIQDNEVVRVNGGEVVYTSTDQSGNFRIGEGVVINQLTGTITGRSFSQSLLNTVTPLLIALGK